MRLIKWDLETGEPVKNEEGFCVQCGPGEVGEFIAQILSETGGASNFR